MRLEGKVVLVTGSTTGIGEAIARRCVAEGARVLIHGRERDLGEKVAGSLGEAAALHVDDLADPEAAPRLVEAALHAFGRLDALVNNAAWVERSTIETTDAAAFDKVIAINVRAPLLLIQAALPDLASARGAVLNIGSINAYSGEATLVAYSSTKGALMTLTRNLGDTLPASTACGSTRSTSAGCSRPTRRSRRGHGFPDWPEGPEGLRPRRPAHPARGDRGRRRLLDQRREPAHQRQRRRAGTVPGDWPQSREGDR